MVGKLAVPGVGQELAVDPQAVAERIKTAAVAAVAGDMLPFYFVGQALAGSFGTGLGIIPRYLGYGLGGSGRAGSGAVGILPAGAFY